MKVLRDGRRLALAGLVFVVTACTSFGTGSSSSSSSGASPPVADDGAAPSIDPDAGLPNAPDGALNPSRFCAQRSDAYRCFDFDGPGDEPWNFLVNGEGGTRFQKQRDAFSKPFAMQCTVSAESDDGAQTCWFAVTDVPVTNTLRLDMMLKLADRGQGGSSSVANIAQPGGGELAVYAQQGKVLLKERQFNPVMEAIYDIQNATSGPLSPSVWTHFVLEVDTVAPKRVRIKVDEVTAIDQPTLYSFWSPQPMIVRVGIRQVFGNPTGAVRRFLYDNIVIDNN
jgi:hypothetical protein